MIELMEKEGHNIPEELITRINPKLRMLWRMLLFNLTKKMKMKMMTDIWRLRDNV